MSLSSYHQKYASYSEEEIFNRGLEKEKELEEIFSKVKPGVAHSEVLIAVLGCGDKRFIPIHKQIFSKLLAKPVKITTFDITVEHLEGGEGVVCHDCTTPLPSGPYDITFAHVLLKFIETEKQWNLIKNSYDALRDGGVAIHVIDKEDYETKSKMLPSGQYSVPLELWKSKLNEIEASFVEVPVKYGLALVIKK